MAYLYHHIPDGMKGNIIYPLNVLKHKYPDIFKEAVKKYSWNKYRRNLLKFKLPILNCLWNDVVHLIPVHPQKIRTALEEAGSKKRKVKWFKIKAEDLEPSKTIVFLHKEVNVKGADRERDFIRYDPKKVSQYDKVPKKTREYFKKGFKEGYKVVFPFQFVPHILYKGSIDISKTKIIEVE